MAKSMHGWYFLSLDTCVEWCSTRLGVRTSAISHIYKRFRHICNLYPVMYSNLLMTPNFFVWWITRQMVTGYRGIWMFFVNGLKPEKLSFNVDRSKVLHYGKGNTEYKYSMCVQPLDEVESEKDLGIVFSRNLKVAAQCNEACTKANCMLGLINRTVKYKNVESLTNLYKSLVRPHLDYCSSVWNPHLSKDKFLLERVQHRFTPMFSDLRKLPDEQRPSHLCLWSLTPSQ